MVALLERKRAYGQHMHSDYCRFQGRTVNQWLAEPGSMPGFLGVLEAGAAMAAFFYVLAHSGWIYGTQLASDDPLYLSATSACFAAIVVLQVANVFLCRQPRRASFGVGFFSNSLLFWAIAVELGLLLFALYTPWGNQLFATQPLPLSVWLLAAGCGLLMVLLEELRKWLLRRYERRNAAALPG